MEIRKVSLAGGGVLGAQIGYQTAFKGFDVTFWGRSDASIGRIQKKVKTLHETYIKELELAEGYIGKENPNYPDSFFESAEDISKEKIEELRQANERAYESIHYTTDLKEAFSDADIVIEAISENAEVKNDFFSNLNNFVSDDAIVLSNSSTFIPSMFKDVINHNERYLHLHFANNIWRQNLAEVMGHENTDKKVRDEVVNFARNIGMKPVVVEKEQPGYLLNSLLVPLLDAAADVWGKGVASPEDIDLAWKKGTGAPRGPFEIIDVVGLRTFYEVNKNSGIEKGSTKEVVSERVSKMIEEGRTGVEAGEGFYKYK